ncbi:MAG: MarR family transcriptional regulator [Alistipes sp.]|nr:MarR family transcriptional regulator [Alistipes sp.]
MEEKIIKALEEGGAMRPGDIATAAGVSKDDVTKAIKKLVADGKVYSPKRCFYDVKK